MENKLFHLEKPSIKHKDQAYALLAAYLAVDGGIEGERKRLESVNRHCSRIVLRKRTKGHVQIFWRKVQDEEIRRMFPLTTESLEQALELFAAAQRKDADSYGNVIYFNGEYVGDVWCYSIDRQNRSAMLSLVIFAKQHWGKGIAPRAISLFLEKALAKYDLERVGAFAFQDNVRSVAALKKAGFSEIETFVENGIASKYLELSG